MGLQLYPRSGNTRRAGSRWAAGRLAPPLLCRLPSFYYVNLAPSSLIAYRTVRPPPGSCSPEPRADRSGVWRLLPCYLRPLSPLYGSVPYRAPPSGW